MNETATDSGTRERILETASELLAERGYAGMTVREIAARVGISNPSLYHHFESKGALLAALVAEPLEVVERSLDEAMQLDGVDRARCIIGGMLDALQVHGGAALAAFRAADDMPEPYRDLALSMRPHIAEMLRDGMAEGQPHLRLTMAIGAIDGVVSDLMRLSSDSADFAERMNRDRESIIELAVGVLQRPLP